MPAGFALKAPLQPRGAILPVDVKICGIRTTEALSAAVAGGVRAVGFVFYPPSPRAVSAEIASELARMLPTGTRAVGLFVDAGDVQIGAIVRRVPLDLLQLHGQEPPRRVAEIKQRFGLPVMKAVRIATADDSGTLTRVRGGGRLDPV